MKKHKTKDKVIGLTTNNNEMKNVDEQAIFVLSSSTAHKQDEMNESNCSVMSLSHSEDSMKQPVTIGLEDNKDSPLLIIENSGNCFGHDIDQQQFAVCTVDGQNLFLQPQNKHKKEENNIINKSLDCSKNVMTISSQERTIGNNNDIGETYESKDNNQVVLIENSESQNDLTNQEGPLTCYYIHEDNSKHQESFNVIQPDVISQVDERSFQSPESNYTEDIRANTVILESKESKEGESAPIIILTVPSNSCNDLKLQGNNSVLTTSHQNNNFENISMDTYLLNQNKNNVMNSNIHHSSNTELKHIFVSNLPNEHGYVQLPETSTTSYGTNENKIKVVDEATIEERIAARNNLLPRPLHRYRKRVLSISYIQCSVCNAKFSNESSKLEHVSQHNEVYFWVCGRCEEKYDKKVKLLQHEASCSTKSYPLKCTHCNHSFTKTLLLHDHLRASHKENLPLPCPICSKPFDKFHDMKMHLNLHLGITKNICDICGKKFGHPSNLIRHRNTHTGVKPYVCGIDGCSLRFSQIPLLHKHRANNHCVDSQSCPQCPQQFKSISGLRIHFRIVHKKNMSSTEASKIISNIRTSNKSRAYYCGVCGKQFKLVAELNMHETTEHIGQEFFCASCNKKFKLAIDLKYHPCNPKSSLNSYTNKNQQEKISSSNNSSLYKPNYVYNLTNLINDTSSNNKEDMLVMYLTPGEDNLTYVVKKRETLQEEVSEHVITVNASDCDLNEFTIDKVTSQPEEAIMIDIEEKAEFVKNDSENIQQQQIYTELQRFKEESIDSDDIAHTSSPINNHTVNFLDPMFCAPSVLEPNTKSPIKKKKVTMKGNNLSINHKSQKKAKGSSQSPKKILKCKDCGKIFKKKWNFQQHEALHDSSLHKYFCKFCKKSFAYRSTLTKHEATHGILRLHACLQCDKVSIQFYFI